ncbi:subunit 17 of mediator complex-domain-containing protein [Corynascus novoguineensis]|uniref:Mediator of RNA polymerase II transcription subunit 17 n=1 Tax=Corynascus novoguineensis TaxID=1126955 RepID=A0AAN7CZK2_9PEZI|nr:subunit 17 of mediator complex-domain-containing protein [Corynascus novoguineensis]
MDDRPFSLQPRSAPQQGPRSIAEFIQRVNAQPGGFRALNWTDVRRELEASLNGGGDQDVDMTGDGSEADSENPETKDIAVARDEILRAIHQTHQTSMFALDFVSLLLSKENPAMAVSTLSPGLRDMVGIGTLGATMLNAPTPVAQSRVPDQKMVSIGKRLMDLNKAADTALATSKRLQREIGLETKYWSEVLGVGEGGWQTFRLPHEPQTLGVKFGFSNTAPEFKASGIAPLRRAEDGSVRLEHGIMGRGSKRIQVKILEKGVVVGKSSLPQPLPPDAPLQDRVKESRDTVFAQELWYEMNREARSDLDNIVRIEKRTATYDMDSTTSISLQLVTLGDEDETTEQQTGPQDAWANALSVILGLLLTNAHRANELKRSEPSLKKGSNPPYFILRPLIAYHKYNQSVQKCAEFLTALISVLRSAGVASSITMREKPLSPLSGSSSSSSSSSTTTTPASTSLATLLLKPPAVHFDLTITPASRLHILLKPTTLSGASYAVSMLPPIQQQNQPPNYTAINPLPVFCPAASEDYLHLPQLVTYLCEAVPCALAAAYFELAVTLPGRPRPAATTAAAASQDGSGDQEEGQQQKPREGEALWGMDVLGKGIVDLDTGGEYGVHFDIVRDGYHDGNNESPKGEKLELRVKADFVEPVVGEDEMVAGGEGSEVGGREGGKKVHREWRWPGTGETVGVIVKQVMSNGPGE